MYTVYALIDGEVSREETFEEAAHAEAHFDFLLTEAEESPDRETTVHMTEVNDSGEPMLLAEATVAIQPVP